MKGRSIAVLVLFFCSVFGLESSLAASQDTVQSLRKQATEYWKARAQSDWVTFYKYIPDDKKTVITKDKFLKALEKENPFSNAQLLANTLGRVEASENLGWVEVTNTLRIPSYPHLPPKTVHFWQVWHKGKENWYPLQEEQLAGVPSLPPSMRSGQEEASLSKRVDEFWTAKERQDWTLVYQYCEPKLKEKMTIDEFLDKKPLYSYLAHHINWTEVTGNHGKIMVTYTRKLDDPNLSKLDPTVETTIENWIKIDDNWYREIPEEALTEESGS